MYKINFENYRKVKRVFLSANFELFPINPKRLISAVFFLGIKFITISKYDIFSL